MTADTIGGVWQYATDLATALAPLGWEVTIAVLGPAPNTLSSPFRGYAAPSLSQGERDSGRASISLSHWEREGARPAKPGGKGEDRAGTNVRVLETNLPLDWLSTSPDPVLAAGEAMAQLAGDLDVDLVHLNTPALAAHARYPVPVVVADHGGLAAWWEAANNTLLPADLAWQRDLAQAGLHAADAVIAPSHAYASTIAHHYGLSNVTPIHNGRAPLPIRANTTRADRAFTAGRLWDQVKNTPVLDRVAARLSVPFHAAGPLRGPHGQEQAVTHLHHLGQLSTEALAAELAARPVFVSAASFEPFGLAVLEAAGAGCPLVLADIATFRELWDGVALFVPVVDDRAHADAITRILADHDLRASMEQASLTRAARYTPQAMATATAAIYDRLLGGERKAAA